MEINNSMRIIKSILILTIVAETLSSCNNTPEKESTHASTVSVDSLKSFKLKTERLDKNISLPGELLAYERVEVRPKITGYIKQLKVDIGTNVRKGQILAVVDAPEIQSRLGEGSSKMNAAKAKFETSLDNYKRIQQASKTKGIISASELQKAKTRCWEIVRNTNRKSMPSSLSDRLETILP
ncbi:MAG: biotin/lipoyl-binding protein [Cyclobacteriaceae bacterium]|nr:MAG: biotin/lipoyl-binding protein [Cyclobacteriaceae bacterium]